MKRKGKTPERDVCTGSSWRNRITARPAKVLPARSSRPVRGRPAPRQETDSRPWPVAALVLVMDPESRLRIDPAVTRVALDLTGMESRVAVLLAEGMSVGQIAAATGRKESTIRSHVKHMFTKHGLSRQVDLVRLVLALAGVPEPRD